MPDTHVPDSLLPAAHRPKSLMILIAGPYRSGTGDDPVLLRENLARLEEAAWPIFQAGHLPMIGEWVALPVLASAGVTDVAHPLAAGVMYPTAERLLERCDAVLRLPGASRGADQDVAIARRRGLPVYTSLAEIPGIDMTVSAGRVSAGQGSAGQVSAGR